MRSYRLIDALSLSLSSVSVQRAEAMGFRISRNVLPPRVGNYRNGRAVYRSGLMSALFLFARESHYSCIHFPWYVG